MSRWHFVPAILGAGALALVANSEPKDDLPSAVAESLGSVLRADLAGNGCGHAGNANFPRKIIVVTAETCYQCWNVGRLLREIELEKRRGGQIAVVLTAVEDTQAVCLFLRREKVQLPLALDPGVERLRRNLADKAILITQLDGNAARLALVRDSVVQLLDVSLDPMARTGR